MTADMWDTNNLPNNSVSNTYDNGQQENYSAEGGLTLATFLDAETNVSEPEVAESSCGDEETDEHIVALSDFEVAPGIKMKLRGSHETQVAIARGFLKVGISCSGCTLEISCIRDAAFVLCPLCHSVTPMEESSSSSTNHNDRGVYGLGLGFIRPSD